LSVHETIYRIPSREVASAFAMEHVHNPDAAGLHSPSPLLKDECECMIMNACLMNPI
jgi:hypothetical protein